MRVAVSVLNVAFRDTRAEVAYSLIRLSRYPNRRRQHNGHEKRHNGNYCSDDDERLHDEVQRLGRDASDVQQPDYGQERRDVEHDVIRSDIVAEERGVDGSGREHAARNADPYDGQIGEKPRSLVVILRQPMAGDTEKDEHIHDGHLVGDGQQAAVVLRFGALRTRIDEFIVDEAVATHLLPEWSLCVQQNMTILLSVNM